MCVSVLSFSFPLSLSLPPLPSRPPTYTGRFPPHPSPTTVSTHSYDPPTTVLLCFLSPPPRWALPASVRRPSSPPACPHNVRPCVNVPASGSRECGQMVATKKHSARAARHARLLCVRRRRPCARKCRARTAQRQAESPASSVPPTSRTWLAVAPSPRVPPDCAL